MKILITGNLGYVGPVVVKYLRDKYKNVSIIGYDTGYFAHCLTNSAVLPETLLDTQFYGDLRDFPSGLLDGVDGLIHLAAISNDPMGNQYKDVTEEINFNASLKIAKLAAQAGIKNYIFASSCSMYGSVEGPPRTEEDSLMPLTTYAKSKAAMEKELSKLQTSMNITCLRFATACGMSPRLRLDLVLNDFVACALTSNEITVLSDGSPWRPLIEVNDMARAIDWALFRGGNNGGQYLAINAGSSAWNFQVNDLANAVAAVIPGVNISINKDAPPDKRSYSVDFSLFEKLAPDHQPKAQMSQVIKSLIKGISGMGLDKSNFRDSEYMRLKVLQKHIDEGRLNSRLFWKN
jgi:UDP-glucose 4-epimerase